MVMGISVDTVRYVSRLARVSLTADEEKDLTKDLAEILTYIEKLNQVDTSEVSPTNHVIEIENIFRKDEPRPSLAPEVVLENAPEKAEGFIEVPKVIENG
jgi:aspartyl-tRNA(Asn)/glutamyl-tRNA(Gln) amidotransferase subunit C